MTPSPRPLAAHETLLYALEVDRRYRLRDGTTRRACKLGLVPIATERPSHGGHTAYLIHPDDAHAFALSPRATAARKAA